MEFDQTQNHRCVYKAVTGKGAFDLWVKEWKYTRRKHVENDSFAHEHSLKHAPDSSNRTFCNEAVSITKVPATRCRLPLFTWHTSSTAFHLTAGHTLTSEYTHRFRPDVPPESACPRRCPDCSFLHPPAVCLPPRTRGAASWRPIHPVDQSSTGKLSYLVQGPSPSVTSSKDHAQPSSRRLRRSGINCSKQNKKRMRF